MRKIVIVLATFVLMAELGISAYVVSFHILLTSMPKNPEGPTHLLRFGALASGAIGSLVPGVAVWYMLKEEHPTQFTLRTILVLVTLMIILLGVIALLHHAGIWGVGARLQSASFEACMLQSNSPSTPVQRGGSVAATEAPTSRNIR